MKPTISTDNLILAVFFLTITYCFLVAMTFGTPLALEKVNELFAYIGFDFALPLPTQFR